MNNRLNLPSGLAVAGLLLLLAVAAWLLAPEFGLHWGNLAGDVRAWQMDLQRGLAGAVRAVRDDGWLAAGPLAGVSFFYGVAHAAGPGHGKAVIGAYVLADGRRLRRGLVIAWASAMAQAVTAVTLITVAAALLGLTAREAQSAAVWLERGGYGLILVIGVVMLVRGWRRWGGPGHQHGHGCGGHHHEHEHEHHDHDHDHHDHHDHHEHEHGPACGHVPLPPADDAVGWKAAALLVLSVGLRPCSGALLVLTFASTMGVYAAGVAATFAMAVGTAITVSLLAVLASGSHRLALRAAGDDVRWLGRIEGGLALLAGLALAVMGGLFLAGSFTPAPVMPFR